MLLGVGLFSQPLPPPSIPIWSTKLWRYQLWALYYVVWRQVWSF